jgi:hypothetical protein
MLPDEIESVRDPADPNADLEGMTDAELRQAIDVMRASIRMPSGNPLRLLRAVVLLRERQGVVMPSDSRPVQMPSLPAVVKRRRARPERSRASARRRFTTLVRRVPGAEGPGPAEALAEFLAIDFVDSNLISKFRSIARGLREGLVDERTVRAAYKAAKSHGVDRPAALFVWYVFRRSPELARARAVWR